MRAMTRWLGLTAVGIGLVTTLCAKPQGLANGNTMSEKTLPAPRRAEGMSLAQCLSQRRSQRAFTTERLSEAQVSQLLWAAQGTTSAEGLRTAPSAGALYPLELYVVRDDGIFHYRPHGHLLRQTKAGDQRADLRHAALDQACVGQAPCVFVIMGVMARTARKYGPERAPRYVWMEAGHAAQNLLLQATALGLGAVPVGAFDDDAVRRVMGVPAEEDPLYLIPVGRTAGH